jgi:hypothetical protein
MPWEKVILYLNAFVLLAGGLYLIYSNRGAGRHQFGTKGGPFQMMLMGSGAGIVVVALGVITMLAAIF